MTIPDGSALADEVDISIEAVAVDSAGNESVISPELTITIDTTIPVASATLDLTDDTGILNDDEFTSVTKPGFIVTAEDASDSVFLYFEHFSGQRQRFHDSWLNATLQISSMLLC